MDKLPAPYRLVEVPDKPFTFEVKPEDRCLNAFQGSNVRCQRRKHFGRESGVCRATGLDPYFAVFWEAPSVDKEGKA